MPKLTNKLVSYPKTTISITELESLLSTDVQSYEEFAEQVLQLEESKVLSMVKAKGRTTRTPSIAFQYRIDKSLLVNDYHKELQRYRGRLHPLINLDEYYSKDQNVWKTDLPFIIQIDQYLKQFSFPTEQVPAPERSYELVGDEKWILEKGGKELLERLGLLQSLNIIPVSEPLMLAINPLNINMKTQYHLIVENKTTYQGLLPVLQQTDFSTLIYGRGKSVLKNIEQFPLQYPVAASHRFFYFGDIDREGIWIWSALNKRQSTILAVPFYRACLNKGAVTGKEYQQERRESVEEFLNYFTSEEQEQIRSLEQGKYYPQETLNTKELQRIWRESQWTNWICKS